MAHGYGAFNERVGYQNIDPTGVKTKGDGMPFLQVPAANGSNTTLDLAVAATSGITGDLALNYSSVRITAGTIATGDCTHTLGDGQWVGQVWELRCDGSMVTSNIVVTITNVIGGQSVFVLNRAGDGLLVRWNGNAWQVLSGQSAFVGGAKKVLAIDPDDDDMDNTTLDLAVAATSGIAGDVALNYDRIEIAAGDIAAGNCTQTIGNGLYDGQIFEIRLTGALTTSILVVTVTNTLGGRTIFNMISAIHGLLMRWNGVAWQILSGDPTQLSVQSTCAADVLAIPITGRYCAKTTGADAEAGTLANGTFDGQLLTVSLIAEGHADGNMSLEPDTKTGFVSVELDELGDTVTFEFINPTVGWIIVGVVGVAAAPIIALS